MGIREDGEGGRVGVRAGRRELQEIELRES